MQMNDHKRCGWRVMVFAVSLFLTVAPLHPLLANTETEPPVKTEPPVESNQPQPASPESEASDSGTSRGDEKPPSPADVPARQVKPFKPSETIGADSAVSFPIDI
jgi:hypothetical protein